jgi:hypothetical protein
MRIAAGDLEYDWIENWAAIPNAESDNGRTHGVVLPSDGFIYVFHQQAPSVLKFDPDGKLAASWGEYPGAHGMTLVREGGDEFLLLTDERTGAVHKTTLDGELVLAIEQADHWTYTDKQANEGLRRYSPTWAAQNPDNGEIWVGDGYGSSFVHRHDRSGGYLDSIDGTSGMGRFNGPHGLEFNPRSATPELYITDRSNARVQIFDGEGQFVRGFADTHMPHPCMFSFCGDQVLIPDLYARLLLFEVGDGGGDRLVAVIGDNFDGIFSEGSRHLTGHAFLPDRDNNVAPNWPNFNVKGEPERIAPGRCNSPHAAALAVNGDIYLVEWILGGRITKLARC